MSPAHAAPGMPPDRALARDYDIAGETVTVAGRALTLWTVRDTNRLLEAIDPATFALDERLPYWAELWSSSIALADWCLQEASLRPGTAVLELGCGLGLAGIAAVLAGAEVTMTDYDPDALRFARANAARNLPAGLLDSPHLRIMQMDWRTPLLERSYELILGADIVYERRMFAPLLALFHRALAPGGAVVLTEPDRSVGADFLAAAQHEGFLVETVRTSFACRGRAAEIVRATLRHEVRP